MQQSAENQICVEYARYWRSKFVSLNHPGVINTAKAANVSLPSLGNLFAYADGGDDVAKRNASLLKSARIVINLRQLLKFARNPFSQRRASDAVEVSIGHGEGGPQFRLAGGQTCTRVVGESDVESLFVELRIQLSSVQAQDEEGAGADRDEMAELFVMTSEAYVRVRRVLELANCIYQASALGWEPAEGDVIEFPTQTPEQIRSIYLDAGDAPVIDPIHDITRFQASLAIGRHKSLTERIANAKDRFPCVSFVRALDVMQRQVRIRIPLLVSMCCRGTLASRFSGDLVCLCCPTRRLHGSRLSSGLPRPLARTMQDESRSQLTVLQRMTARCLRG